MIMEHIEYTYSKEKACEKCGRIGKKDGVFVCMPCSYYHPKTYEQILSYKEELELALSGEGPIGRKREAEDYDELHRGEILERQIKLLKENKIIR